MPAGHLYRYESPSTLSDDGMLGLSTSGGVSEIGPVAFMDDPVGVAHHLDSARLVYAGLRLQEQPRCYTSDEPTVSSTTEPSASAAGSTAEA